MKSNAFRKRKEVRDKMKIFDVDVSVKYIVFKMDGHQYIVQFIVPLLLYASQGFLFKKIKKGLKKSSRK